MPHNNGHNIAPDEHFDLMIEPSYQMFLTLLKYMADQSQDWLVLRIFNLLGILYYLAKEIVNPIHIQTELLLSVIDYIFLDYNFVEFESFMQMS